jgi:hypothetical protein
MSQEIKTCNHCQESKHLEKFPKHKKRKDGTWYRRRMCNPCYNLTKEFYRQEKRNWFKNYKESLSCSCCGYSKKTHKHFSTWALEFHHHDKNKSYNVGNMINQGGYALSTIQKEIDKCIILCCRCHRENHGNF